MDDLQEILDRLHAQTITNDQLARVVIYVAENLSGIRQALLEFEFDSQSGMSKRWQDFYRRNPDLLRKRAKCHPLVPIVESEAEKLLRFAWMISEGKAGIGPNGIHETIQNIGDLSQRTKNKLINCGIERVSDLLGLSYNDFQDLVHSIPGMGPKMLEELHDFMGRRGLYGRSVPSFGRGRGIRPDEEFGHT
jgi:hypothetical protein